MDKNITASVRHEAVGLQDLQEYEIYKCTYTIAHSIEKQKDDKLEIESSSSSFEDGGHSVHAEDEDPLNV